MSENYTGTGTANDPITPTVRPTFRDMAAEAIADAGTTAESFLTEFSANADLGYDLPDDVRSGARRASDAVSKALSTARKASDEIATTLNDIRMYPEGRKVIAANTREAAQSDIADAINLAMANLTVTEAQSYESARPKLHARDGAAARADATMILDGYTRNGGSLNDAVKRLAGRDDAVGALVADGQWLKDYAFARGVDPQVIDAVNVTVRHSVIETSANSSDPARRAAARTNQALRSLRQAAISAQTYGRLKLKQ
jgi:hypothetical protein